MLVKEAIPAQEAKAVIDNLRSKAASLLGAALGSSPLVSFATGGLGNFPYYWQNPSNLEFNLKTYNWINANFLSGSDPKQQASGSTFTGEFIQALGSITYSLSTNDQANLNQALQNATNQQAALLNQWRMIYGSLPTPPVGQTPIDVIVNTICTTWSSDPTCSLMKIQNAPNLNQLLDKTPASGEPILPLLANWVNALGSSVSLQNAVSMNNGYKTKALNAVQYPTTDNGATAIGSTYYPTYNIATQLSDIINGLQATGNAIDLEMSIERTSSNEFSVSISGGTSFNIPIFDFFSLGIGGNASYFQDNIATSSNSVQIKMKFTGVTLVQYAPAAFEESTGKNWFYMKPILDAIKNTGKDVSSYKFSPNPNIDFSTNGPFGLTQGCAISNYPSIEIVVISSDYKSIEKTFQQSTSTQLSFLGIPLGGVSESTYSHSLTTDASASKITITLNPPKDLVAGTSVDSQGWVLGVQTNYPAS